MRSLVIRLIIVLVFTISIKAQELTPAQRYHVTNGAQGREFFIAIPPNEVLPFPADDLEIYVSSAYDTEVEVFDYSHNSAYKRKVNAGQIRTLSSARSEVNWTWEIRDYEKVVKKAIRLRSEMPITVSVLNSKVTTTDGYTAIPVSNWDTSYIVTSYYDFKEFKPWSGGFTVIAKENGTKINVLLRGTGELDGKTAGGKTINTGQSFQVSMDGGDVYFVKGNGQTRGVFDLTGTSITSNKPVGLISSHERTTMPNLLVNGNGRNHLVEMNVPVSMWDTSYVSLQFKRENLNGQGDGDVLRVVAAEANTAWRMKSYDLITKLVVREQSGIIANAGGFAEIAQVAAPAVLVTGLTEWTADKPIQVIQYSCSSSMDGDPILDPFQINVQPKSRYINGAVFNAPTTSKFSKHTLYLILLADPTDPLTIQNLKSITIDGKSIWNHSNSHSPTLLFNNIPGTSVWSTRIDFGTESNSHLIVSPKVPFSGNINGFGEFDAYGWNLGPLHANNVARDTVPPVVVKTETQNGAWLLDVSETTNIPSIVRDIPLPTDQVDAGIAVAGLMSSSVNLRLTTVQAPGERRTEAAHAIYKVESIDTTSPGSGRVYVLDYAANVRYVDVGTTPPPLRPNKQTIDFGNVRVFSQKLDSVTITNITNQQVVVDSIQISNTSFSTLNVTTPFSLAAAASRTIHVVVTPPIPAPISGTITFATDLAPTVVSLQAVGVAPELGYVSRFFGRTFIDSMICPPQRVLLTNSADDTLIISRLDLVPGDGFTFNMANCPPLPIKLVKGDTIKISCICFTSTLTGAHEGTLLVYANDQQAPHEIPLNAAVDPVITVDEDATTNEISIRHAGGVVECTWNETLRPTHWTLTTINGELSLSGDIAQNVRSISIDTSSLSVGVYALQIQTRSGVVRKSVVIGQ